MEGVEYGELERVAPLLRWLSDDALVVEFADFQVGPLPEYLKSPVRMRLEAPTPMPSVIRLQLGTEPMEIYAVCKPHDREENSGIFHVTLIEPAFTGLFLKYVARRPETQSSLASRRISDSQALPAAKRISDSQASLADASISLGNWTPSQEPTASPATDIKGANKGTLKKLMLLSLRHVGVDKHHREFASIWKHLYCGCLFALRKDLGMVGISQKEMLTVIRSNMNLLNIK